MSNLPLKALPWKDLSQGEVLCVRADSPIYYYAIVNDDKAFKVGYYNRQSPIKYATGFATIEDAKTWCWNHYKEKMQPYVALDSINDIANWFKAAKPEPTDKDICTQIGCHYEEVAEMSEAIGAECDAVILADVYKRASDCEVDLYANDIDHIELLDALCDQIVTATGVAYMMGFDIEGALKEVIRSNNSKMVDGKFEFDANGKIMKPDSYSKPDLTKFVEVTK